MKRKRSESYETLAGSLGRRLASQMKLKNIDQKELAERIGQSQSTISNIITGKTDSSMKNLFLAYEALELDPLEEIRQVLLNKNIPDNTSASGEFVNDPKDPVFIGQKGIFFTYFLPTRKYEDQLVRGVLNIIGETGRCIAELRIRNNISAENALDPDDGDKIYKGDVHIAKLPGAVYINLKNEKFGEMCQIICPLLNIQTYGKSLKYNMGVATTICAGAESRIPTIHRIFLSREILSPVEEQEIRGQLLLNKQDIQISEKKFQEMCEKELPGKEFLQCFQKHSSRQIYYEISEDSFKKLLKEDSSAFRDLCMLRLYSSAPRNNKVSSQMIGSIFHGLDIQKQKQQKV